MKLLSLCIEGAFMVKNLGKISVLVWLLLFVFLSCESQEQKERVRVEREIAKDDSITKADASLDSLGKLEPKMVDLKEIENRAKMSEEEKKQYFRNKIMGLSE